MQRSHREDQTGMWVRLRNNAALKTQQTASTVAAAPGASRHRRVRWLRRGAKAAGSAVAAERVLRLLVPAVAVEVLRLLVPAVAVVQLQQVERRHRARVTRACRGAERGRSAANQGLEGRVFGAGVTLADSVAVDELLANADTYVVKRPRGGVSGCAPSAAADQHRAKARSSLRFKVRDGVMVFPVEDAGKYAVEVSCEDSLEPRALEGLGVTSGYKVDIDPDAITSL